MRDRYSKKNLYYRRFRRAQSTLEFAMVASVVAVALMSISVYFSRSIQGRVREVSDNIGEQYDPTKADAHTYIDHAITTKAHSYSGREVLPDGTEGLVTYQNMVTELDLKRLKEGSDETIW